MGDEKEKKLAVRGELRGMVHQEIWQTLPAEKEEELKELAREAAEEKGVPLRNPVPSVEQLKDNRLMMQYFEWYVPDDGAHWDRLREDAPHLKSLGVGGLWLPPFCKATGTNDTGYGSYDLYDLGEFDQKGSVRTKYGTKEGLKAAVSALHEQGIQAYADAVLNHKAGADEAETFKVVRVSPGNREETVGEAFDIEGWTRFSFPGRQGKYSAFQWNFQHFTGVNYDQKSGATGVFLILGDQKGFSDQVSNDQGNADYLMFADVDYRNPDVIDETMRWGDWVIREMDLDGMRMDAVKHIDHRFMEAFIRHVRLGAEKPLFFVGEYWQPLHGELEEYIHQTDGLMALFDVALHYRFAQASASGRDYDMRTIFHDTLISRNALNCVTFVDNHDTQPGQALESWVQDWFKPLAYALILLRQSGYPCLFYGDYYGISGEHGIPGKAGLLDPLLQARLKHAYGEQTDYFDHANTIGWVRMGDETHEKSGLACVMTNGDAGTKNMSLGEGRKGTEWYDITGNIREHIRLDDAGRADFRCQPGSVSVYVQA